MELVKISSVTPEVKGTDEFNNEIRVINTQHLKDLKIGDLVQGYIYHDQQNSETCYLRATRRVQWARVTYTVSGTLDTLVEVPNLEEVESVIANHISDEELIQGVIADQVIEGDQITITSIESLPDHNGDSKHFFVSSSPYEQQQKGKLKIWGNDENGYWETTTYCDRRNVSEVITELVKNREGYVDHDFDLPVVMEDLT